MVSFRRTTTCVVVHACAGSEMACDTPCLKSVFAGGQVSVLTAEIALMRVPSWLLVCSSCSSTGSTCDGARVPCGSRQPDSSHRRDTADGFRGHSICTPVQVEPRGRLPADDVSQRMTITGDNSRP